MPAHIKTAQAAAGLMHVHWGAAVCAIDLFFANHFESLPAEEHE